MAILQPAVRGNLTEKLRRNAGNIRYLPRLSSSNPSLNGQPSLRALGRELCNQRQVILEGIAGSGKTVLALSLALDGNLNCAYIEAASWSPSSIGILDNLLMYHSGCDYAQAMSAFREKSLILIIEAIDEAPWSPLGKDLNEALTTLSGEIDGKAGLLITTRSSTLVPALAAEPSEVRLAGIEPGQVEFFLALYSGSRTGVSDLARRLAEMDFPEELRYSPLLLRRLAEGLSTDDIPSNVVELYEKMVEFDIQRECGKPATMGLSSASGSWQESYSRPDTHRQLASALVFCSGKRGRLLASKDLEGIATRILAPMAWGPRAMVQVSTLMAQHPLVAVSYREEAGQETYYVECLHDWARAGLLPRFLTQESLTAALEVLDDWHEALPHHEDYSAAWSWLEETGRASENLECLLEFASSRAQAETVAKWLAAQMFSPQMPQQIVSKLFSVVASLAYRFAPVSGDLCDILGLSTFVPGPLLFAKQKLELTEPGQIANFGNSSFEETSLTVTDTGPSSVYLRGCILEGFKLNVLNRCTVHLIGCHLAGLQAQFSESATLIVENCVYDPASCLFPPKVIGLDSCEAVPLGKRSEYVWALAEVLRRFIVVAQKCEHASKRTNLNEENL